MSAITKFDVLSASFSMVLASEVFFYPVSTRSFQLCLGNCTNTFGRGKCKFTSQHKSVHKMSFCQAKKCLTEHSKSECSSRRDDTDEKCS